MHSGLGYFSLLSLGHMPTPGVSSKGAGRQIMEKRCLLEEYGNESQVTETARTFFFLAYPIVGALSLW